MQFNPHVDFAILSNLLLFGLVSSAYSKSRGRNLKEVVLDHSAGEYSHQTENPLLFS